MTENSAEMAGGTAHGINAYSDETDPSTIDSLISVMTDVGKWIEDSAGTFLGHVKMAVSTGDAGSMTMNLTDMRTGVECHGSMVFPFPAEIRFMAAVLDVDHKELAKRMETSLTANGFKIKCEPKGFVKLG